MPSLLTCAEMYADHIASSGSPHNNVLHFSSYFSVGVNVVIAVCLMETPAECFCYIEVLRLSAFVIHLDSNCVSLQEVQIQSFRHFG